MDITETYIKMSDHPLIQGQWEPREGDVYIGKESRFFSIYAGACTDYINGIDIWLPRQDQIQEMLGGGGKCGCTVCLVTGLYHFMENNLEGMFEAGIEGTMELLWLAFYMHEKHNLKWEDGKWQ